MINYSTILCGVFLIWFILYHYGKLKHEEERAKLLKDYLSKKRDGVSWEDYCYSLGKEYFI